MTRNAAVAEMVRRRCPDADVLLEMLGVEIDGVMQPDDDRDYSDVDTAQLGSRSKGDKVVSVYDDMRVRPAASTAPDALRNLPPVEVKTEPKPKRQHRATLPREKSTWSPRKSQIGTPAQIAAAQATARGRWAPCGEYGAYRRHLRHHEPIDELCAEAARKQWRERDKTRVRARTTKKAA